MAQLSPSWIVQSRLSTGLLALDAEKRNMDAEGMCRMGTLLLDALPDPKLRHRDRNATPFDLCNFALSERVAFLQDMQPSLSVVVKVRH